jgi:hypothetical protein
LTQRLKRITSGTVGEAQAAHKAEPEINMENSIGNWLAGREDWLGELVSRGQLWEGRPGWRLKNSHNRKYLPIPQLAIFLLIYYPKDYYNG